MLELKIGNIELNKKASFDNWRFILAKEKGTVTLYAKLLPEDGSSFLCRDAVEENGISHSSIIGGGGMRYSSETLKMTDFSADYGIIPNSLMEEFAPIIFEHIKEKYPIKKVEIDMWYDPGESERKNPKHIEMWKRLGYEFDNQKRVLEFKS
jgi:hypothetical protein